jgi:dipeptidyl aminopeptidase/acylaminoacyl peptidase
MKGVHQPRLEIAYCLTAILLLVSSVVVTGPGVALAGVPGGAQGNEALRVKVIPDFIVVREGRGDGTALVAQLVQGAEVPVIGAKATAGWWQVQLPDGRQGWVNGASEFVQVIGSDGKPIVNDDPPATPTGMLVFQTSSGGAIYVINADGSNLHLVTNGMDPALSPDRKWIAFTRWDAASAGLYVIKTDGTGERKLFAEPLVKSPSWSPDGTQIAISHQNGGHIGVWEDKTTGGAGGRGGGGSSTPSGPQKQISINRPADARWKIGLVRVSDGYFTDLASHDYSYSPSFSPDGKHIAYASDKGISLTWENAPSAVSRDPNMATVSNMRFNDRSPAWSPDGTRIAFQYKTNDHSEIFVMNADGNGRTPLTQSDPLATVPVSNVAPAWSPDGSQVAYLSNADDQWDIWVVDADGGNPHPLFKAGTLKDIEFDYENVDERMLSWR